MISIIDTHTHLDAPDFAEDRPQVMQRAKDAGLKAVMIPAINASNVQDVLKLCRQYPDFAYPMLGLQPEEVKDDWQQQLRSIRQAIDSENILAIGEVGLDFYWSRTYEKEQLKAFEAQIEWALELDLPLMIHCRKAQAEMMRLLRPYPQLRGVFHCFTGNTHEAEEFLRMPHFALGIGGVLTFKSSKLREDLPAAVPLSRIVLETDSPYMAPVPHRGKRNESAFVIEVMKQLAQAYHTTEEDVAMQTNNNVRRIFGIG